MCISYGTQLARNVVKTTSVMDCGKLETRIGRTQKGNIVGNGSALTIVLDVIVCNVALSLTCVELKSWTPR